MNDDEIEKAVKEAAEFEAQDKKRKEGIDARNEADSMVFQTEKALNDVGDGVDAAEKEKVQAEIDKVKAILERTTPDNMSDADVDELKAAKESLMTNAQQVFAKVYEQAQQAAGAQGAGPDMGGAAGQQRGRCCGRRFPRTVRDRWAETIPYAVTAENVDDKVTECTRTLRGASHSSV